LKNPGDQGTNYTWFVGVVWPGMTVWPVSHLCFPGFMRKSNALRDVRTGFTQTLSHTGLASSSRSLTHKPGKCYNVW
jgi:hypothetical protein